MYDWNVVVSLHEGAFIQALKLLDKLGPVNRTAYFNVLVMKVEDIAHFLETLRQWEKEEPGILSLLSRVMPVTQTFTFQSVEEFERKAKEASLTFISDLAGRRFHIRMHRRGFKGRLSSQNEEQFLDDMLMQALDEIGEPGRITFENPDAIISVETVDSRAGLSLWTREDMIRYPFLHLD
jgi:tRNA(Ser,Leu) C12 N-acetylase TAN1